MSDEAMGGRGVKYVPPGGARALWVWGGLVRFSALGEDTSPQSGAFPHVHHEEDQAFYVLEGEHEFVCDGQNFAAETGSFVYVPRGTVHSFTNVSTTPGRILVLSTPAGGTERFFFEVGEPATDESSPPPTSRGPESMDDVARLREIAQRHGSDIDPLALLQQLSASNPLSDQEDG
jgi:mannose-6-phosphate isomerase-like protein (cupin superfamily)